MTDGDIYNRQTRIQNTLKSLEEDESVSDHNLEIILDLKKFLESQNFSLDRISRYFYSLKFIVQHIDCKLDETDKEKLVDLVRDINEGELWEDVEEIRRSLADERGIYVDLIGATVMSQELDETPDEEIETREPSIYPEDEDGVYGVGTFESEYDNPDSHDWERKLHHFGEKPPEEAQPDN
ncbi:MAG: hypothetical protein ABEJ03_03475 [Candidatus Nanohaloarchaea archaeon]